MFQFLKNDRAEQGKKERIATHFDYAKPELWDFSACGARGDSCFIDCTTDDICPTLIDEI